MCKLPKDVADSGNNSGSYIYAPNSIQLTGGLPYGQSLDYYNILWEELPMQLNPSIISMEPQSLPVK